MKKPTIELSEKGKRLQIAIESGTIIVDAIKLASAILQKEPELFLDPPTISIRQKTTSRSHK